MTGTITDESRIVEITRDSKDVDALTKLSSTTTANSIHSRKSAGSFDLTDLSLFHIPDHPLGRLSLCQFPWLSSSQQQPPTAVAATSASVAKLPSPSQGDSHTLSLSDEKRPIDVTAPFTCDECGKLCRDAKSLSQHKRCHSKTHRCKIPSCWLKFSTRRDLYRHQASVHDLERTCACPYCSKKVAGSRIDNLKRHMNIFCRVRRKIMREVEE